MSFFSRSSKKSHYKNGNYGSNQYQNKGILGDLFKRLIPQSGSGGHYNNHGNQSNNMPMPNQPFPNQPFPNQPLPNQSIINCGKCASKIPTGSKFCLECGDKVQDALFCANCGEKVPPNSKFCLKCGNKLNG